MRIQEEQYERVILLSPEGIFDAAGGEALRQRLQSLMESRFDQFVLDLSGVEQLLPEGLETLRRIKQLTDEHQAAIAVYEARAQQRETLAPVCQSYGWPLADTLQAAIREVC